MAMPVTRRWTLDEVHALADAATDGTRYELIDGVLLVTPSPRMRHQIALRELLAVLHPYLRSAGVGEVLFAPVDLKLAPDSVTHPDIFIVPRESQAEVLGGVISLLIEVLSPSTERTDRGIKRAFYLAHGVAEYWVVDADARTIERIDAVRPGSQVAMGTLHRGTPRGEPPVRRRLPVGTLRWHHRPPRPLPCPASASARSACSSARCCLSP